MRHNDDTLDGTEAFWLTLGGLQVLLGLGVLAMRFVW
jgi:hypothetical protein